MSKRKLSFVAVVINAADELPEAEFRAGIEAGQALLKRREPKATKAAKAATRAEKAKGKTNSAGTASSEPPPEVVQ